MHFIKFVSLFIRNNMKQIKRQWFTLPLLLFFPIVLIGLSIFLVSVYLVPNEQNPLEIGLVDLDGSKETQMVMNMLEEQSDYDEIIKVTKFEEKVAEAAIKKNTLSAYIVFPKDFIHNLYEGVSVEVKVMGNPRRKAESEMTKELIDSVMRHINTSQANILVLNDQAKEVGMSDEIRQEYLLDQFTSFLLYTTGKDKALNKDKLTQHQNTSPMKYYTLALWFIVLITWLFLIYNFLYKGESEQMSIRIRLYGVTERQKIIARIIVTLLVVIVLMNGLFYLFMRFNHIEIELESLVQIMNLTVLTSFIYLCLLAILEMLIKSSALRLIVQLGITFILVLLSGALIPLIYFPLIIQEYSVYLPFNHTFNWLKEVIINERFIVEYGLLVKIAISCLLGFLVISDVKERIK